MKVLTGKQRGKRIRQSWQLYIMILLPLTHLLIFAYYPLYGLNIAFKNYTVGSMGDAEWVGFANFTRFFSAFNFWEILGNTFFLAVYSLIIGFPVPIMLALGLNAVQNKYFRKTVQMLTYAPYFISTVVLVGIMMQIFAPRIGLIDQIGMALGNPSRNIMADPNAFYSLYVWSGIWQSAGYSSIIYIAALASVPPELHEAALIDGASRWKRIVHIDLPEIMPTAMTLLIISVGNMVSSISFEKAFLLQNQLNLSKSEVLGTFIYKQGLASVIPDYGYGAAIGIFQSLIGICLILMANAIVKRVNQQNIW